MVVYRTRGGAAKAGRASVAGGAEAEQSRGGEASGIATMSTSEGQRELLHSYRESEKKESADGSAAGADERVAAREDLASVSLHRSIYSYLTRAQWYAVFAGHYPVAHLLTLAPCPRPALPLLLGFLDHLGTALTRRPGQIPVKAVSRRPRRPPEEHLLSAHVPPFASLPSVSEKEAGECHGVFSRANEAKGVAYTGEITTLDRNSSREPTPIPGTVTRGAHGWMMTESGRGISVGNSCGPQRASNLLTRGAGKLTLFCSFHPDQSTRRSCSSGASPPLLHSTRLQR